MKGWSFCCFMISSVAIITHLISSTECIDSQDRGAKGIQEMDGSKNDTPPGNTLTAPAATTTTTTMPSTLVECSDHSGHGIHKCLPSLPCNKLAKECLKCDFNCTCVYGQEVSVTCKAKKKTSSCEGDFIEKMTCRYCYQTASWEHTCEGNEQCQAVNSPREMFTSNCTVKSDILCLGNRSFPKRLPCNWTSGYKWSTALLLSITLGGFGADRFYLGHWQEGIGKLFSFGGLGVWTIMDVILIAIRYLGPADGSLYI